MEQPNGVSLEKPDCSKSGKCSALRNIPPETWLNNFALGKFHGMYGAPTTPAAPTPPTSSWWRRCCPTCSLDGCRFKLPLQNGMTGWIVNVFCEIPMEYIKTVSEYIVMLCDFILVFYFLPALTTFFSSLCTSKHTQVSPSLICHCFVFTATLQQHNIFSVAPWVLCQGVYPDLSRVQVSLWLLSRHGRLLGSHI